MKTILFNQNGTANDVVIDRCYPLSKVPDGAIGAR